MSLAFNLGIFFCYNVTSGDKFSNVWFCFCLVNDINVRCALHCMTSALGSPASKVRQTKDISINERIRLVECEILYDSIHCTNYLYLYSIHNSL